MAQSASPQLVLIAWGRLATCGGLVIRLVLDTEFTYGPIANRPQVTNLPYKIGM